MIFIVIGIFIRISRLFDDDDHDDDDASRGDGGHNINITLIRF